MSETPAPYRVALAGDKPGNLTEWEWRLVLKCRILRSKNKSCTLQVQFDGPATLLFVLMPAGKVE